jgi:hypothetical protein
MTDRAHMHRFFQCYGYTGQGELTEIHGPPWTPALPPEFRYPYDILEAALPLVEAEGLRFCFTKEAYSLPEYGPDVVGVLLQEERCKVPVYGRHVRAVIRNLLTYPFLGYRPHFGMTRLEAVLTFEFARDSYTCLRARYALSHPPANYPAPVRVEPRTIRLPLGYHSQVEVPQIAMVDRPLDTFFAGQIGETIPSGSYKHYTSTSKIQARKQIWHELRALQAKAKWCMDLGDIAADQQHQAPAAFSNYSEKMMQSRICVAPRGSMADSYRAFEGLRAGCLVVANRLPKDEFLYPDAPLLILDHWRELGGILDRYARDIEALEQWRARSLDWWHTQLRPEVVAVMVADKLNEAGETLL